MFRTWKLTILLSISLALTSMAEKPVVPEGFEFKTLYQVPKKEQGSWVCMTVDDKGRFITSDQYGSLFRVTVGKDDEVSVEKIPVKMGGAQGLLWFQGKLYVTTATNKVVPEGLYVITDTDGDDQLDKVELWRKLNGGGEHGPHSLVASPDGKWIYLASGNFTRLPKDIDHFHNTKKWGEDQLIPSQPDARGHASGLKAPAGWIVRFTPDGKRYELFSQGYRNQYDMAFNVDGELFTYDADMEYDFGTPWYRPTRICHVTSGSEFGWRSGTGKWPASYLDCRPSVVDIGPGSPTGVISGLEADFPTRYRESVFILDWTFATIYAIHLQHSGGTYTAKKEEFLTSSGTPLTDGVIGKDGAMYVLTGGRRTDSALHRISYVGKESTNAPVAKPLSELAKVRRKLDTLHLEIDVNEMDFIWENLNSSDRAVRYSARVALEHLPVNLWLNKALSEKSLQAQFEAAVAVAHQVDDPEAGKKMLEGLISIAFEKLGTEDKVNLLRSQGLLFARLGEQNETLRNKVIAQLDPHYPSGDALVDRELCRMLCYLQAPSVVEKTLLLMASETPSEIPEWAELASRNEKYGKDVLAVLNNMPPMQSLHYAYCLRVVKGPWTKGQREQYFAWFNKASQKSGGKSYSGFLKNFLKEALTNATPEEQKMAEGLNIVVNNDPFKDLPTPVGPGKNWKVKDIVALGDLAGADLKNGERMYRASLCAACHQVKGKGGGAGPDLSNSAGRFKLKDFAEAIINPNEVISNQYEFKIIHKTDGSSVTGKILDEKDAELIVAINAFDFDQTVVVREDHVKSMKSSPTSPMPPALINRLNKKELRDLMGYLMSLK